MSKPCECGRATPGVPYEPPACRLCWLALNDERYARLWSTSRPTVKITVAVPCVHVGDALTGPEREALGLSHGRRWHLCEHPDQPLGEAVCGCMRPVGCGLRCPGYAAP